jgi:hypothetical protein
LVEHLCSASNPRGTAWTQRTFLPVVSHSSYLEEVKRKKKSREEEQRKKKSREEEQRGSKEEEQRGRAEGERVGWGWGRG